MSVSSPLRPIRLPLFSLCLILLSQHILSQSNAVETVSNHAPVLQVQAREMDTMPIRSSEPVTINIHIMDANDNSPEFEQPVYTASTAATGDPRPIVMVGADCERY